VGLFQHRRFIKADSTLRLSSLTASTSFARKVSYQTSSLCLCASVVNELFVKTTTETQRHRGWTEKSDFSYKATQSTYVATVTNVLRKRQPRFSTGCATIIPHHFKVRILRSCHMKCAAAVFLVLSLVSTVVCGQTTNLSTKHSTAKSGTYPAPGKTSKICLGVPIPEGYIVVAYENSSSCPRGAYVIKRDDGSPAPQAPVAVTTASRPRTVGNAIVNSVALNPPQEISNLNVGPPELKGSLSPTLLDAPVKVSSATSLDDKEEVGEGDVIRTDTNLVTVPVSVLDRDGRYISDLRREQFKVFENGVEQKIAYFESNEKPFTVALLLDTSGSTFFHLWEIKEAAIAFA